MIQNSTFTFLDKLRENNTSEWFKANEEEYRELQKLGNKIVEAGDQ